MVILFPNSLKFIIIYVFCLIYPYLTIDKHNIDVDDDDLNTNWIAQRRARLREDNADVGVERGSLRSARDANFRSNDRFRSNQRDFDGVRGDDRAVQSRNDVDSRFRDRNRVEKEDLMSPLV